MDILIKNTILHVLDINSQMPIISKSELELDSGTKEFIEKHITKLYIDPATKEGQFAEGEVFIKNEVQTIISDIGGFIKISENIASYLFDIMAQNVDIPSCDLLVSLVEIENTPYLAILKFNYKESYTHMVVNSGDGVNNQIIKYKTLLPSESQKVEEGVIINLNNLKLKVVEKSYEINGEQKKYFSEMFLNCETNLSKKETIKVINEAVKEITKRYNNDDIEATSKLKSSILESCMENSVIDVEKIATDVFANKPQMQNEYIEKVREAGVPQKMILDEEYAEKRFSTQKIKTDNGIELSFPLSLFQDKNTLEFINNADGTISILIKNISKIINK